MSTECWNSCTRATARVVLGVDGQVVLVRVQRDDRTKTLGEAVRLLGMISDQQAPGLVNGLAPDDVVPIRCSGGRREAEHEIEPRIRTA